MMMIWATSDIGYSRCRKVKTQYEQITSIAGGQLYGCSHSPHLFTPLRYGRGWSISRA